MLSWIAFGDHGSILTTDGRCTVYNAEGYFLTPGSRALDVEGNRAQLGFLACTSISSKVNTLALGIKL
jgi:hypothetical protein